MAEKTVCVHPVWSFYSSVAYPDESLTVSGDGFDEAFTSYLVNETRRVHDALETRRSEELSLILDHTQFHMHEAANLLGLSTAIVARECVKQLDYILNNEVSLFIIPPFHKDFPCFAELIERLPGTPEFIYSKSDNSGYFDLNDICFAEDDKVAIFGGQINKCIGHAEHLIRKKTPDVSVMLTYSIPYGQRIADALVWPHTFHYIDRKQVSHLLVLQETAIGTDYGLRQINRAGSLHEMMDAYLSLPIEKITMELKIITNYQHNNVI
jgi:hypothetical protein